MSNQSFDFLNTCLLFMQKIMAQPCALCGARSLSGALCPGCRADLPPLAANLCPQCAVPTADGGLCGHCLKRPPPFTATRAALSYAYPLDGLIQRLKYGHELALAPLFAGLLRAALQGVPRPDLIVPMPLHPDRLKERGFNQAVEIGRPLAKGLDIRMEIDAARRLRDTPAQAGLTYAARMDNLKNAFTCDTNGAGKLAGKRIALLDDVMTTGASLDALARAILAAGAREVEVWVVARTPDHPR